MAVTVAFCVAAMMLGMGRVQATPTGLGAGSEYVNLGDSYSAGSGVKPQVVGSNPRCDQSLNNPAHLIARANGLRLTDVSCGGATTSDLFTAQLPGVAPQVDALGPNTKLVTLMIGGNDEDVFLRMLSECVASGGAAAYVGSPCRSALGNSIADLIKNQTYPNLVNFHRAVRARAPHATIAVANYPCIVPASARRCPGFPVAPSDISFIFGLWKALNDVVTQAAKQVGFTLVDVASASIGHDSCQPVGVRWVEPLVSLRQYPPVHPNALGDQQIARLVSRTLGLK